MRQLWKGKLTLKVWEPPGNLADTLGTKGSKVSGYYSRSKLSLLANVFGDFLVLNSVERLEKGDLYELMS
jgi:hypothetical protein